MKCLIAFIDIYIYILWNIINLKQKMIYFLEWNWVAGLSKCGCWSYCIYIYIYITEYFKMKKKTILKSRTMGWTKLVYWPVCLTDWLKIIECIEQSIHTTASIN